jgi:hypothetical protein
VVTTPAEAARGVKGTETLIYARDLPVGYKNSIGRHQASNYTAESNRCHRPADLGMDWRGSRRAIVRETRAPRRLAVVKQADKTKAIGVGPSRGRPPLGGGRRATRIRKDPCGLGT